MNYNPNNDKDGGIPIDMTNIPYILDDFYNRRVNMVKSDKTEPGMKCAFYVYTEFTENTAKEIRDLIYEAIKTEKKRG